MKRILFATIVLALVMTTGFTIANTGAAKNFSFAQEPSSQSQQRQSDVRDLTSRLADLNSRYQLGNKAERGYLLAELKSVAATRRQILSQLMESDPAEVLRVALPDEIRAGMPAQLQSYLEQQVSLDGELEVTYREDEVESRLLHFLTVSDKRYELHFDANTTTNLQSGMRAHVRGVLLGTAVALDGISDTESTSLTSSTAGLQLMQTTAAVAPNTFGEQKVLVLLVNFQDNQTKPWTTDQVRNVVFGSVNDFYKETSYQQTWLTGDVFGYYTLPINATCTESTISTYAKQAAIAAGVNLAAYNRHVYAFPGGACGWTGSGTVGGNPSQAWINGSMSLRTVGHELGHGLGLYHARAMDCGSTVIGSNCTVVEYGDILDILGQSGITGHSDAQQKERLGWLNYGSSPSITTVETNGTYWIDPYETMGSNAKALKILKSVDPITGIKTWYYIEFRRPLGFDSFISSNSSVMNGVMIHTGVEPYGRDNYLLDMTPGTTSFSDAALAVGRSYNDPNTNVTVTPVSLGNTGASVAVSFGPQPCVAANPGMSLSPAASQWVRAGSTVSYQVSVTNNDSGCSAANFYLQANTPGGWIASFTNPTVSLPPGATATVNLAITSPDTAADGFYTIGVSASNSAAAQYSASGTITCSLVSGLGLSVASDQVSYTRSQTATVTAMVTAGGSPVAGASVNFTMTRANGTKVTGTATTSTGGAAVFKYRFNKQKDPVGMYQVGAAANLNGVVGTGSISFSVLQ